MNFIAVFAHPAVRYAIVPIGSAVFGVFVKCEMRHHDKRNIQKEDFAVGIQLNQTACFAMLTLLAQKGIQYGKLAADHANLYEVNAGAELIRKHEEQMNALAYSALNSGIEFGCMILCLMCMVILTRRVGWEDKDKMRIVPGIAVPMMFGVFSIYMVMAAAADAL